MGGGLMYHRLEKYSDAVSVNCDFDIATCLFIVLYLGKYLMQRSAFFMSLQFLNQVFTLGCVITFFRFYVNQKKTEYTRKVCSRFIIGILVGNLYGTNFSNSIL